MKHLSTIRAMTLGAACVLSACGTNDSKVVGPSDEPDERVAEAHLAAAKGAVPPDQRASLGASPTIPQEPLECQDVIEERPCKRYSIQLLGNPSMDPVARAKYKAAFGSACYMSEANTFGCFYKKADVKQGGNACKHAQMVAAVFGVAPYDDHPETCKATPGTNEEQFTLQVGPDTANVVFIKLENAPLESSSIDMGNGVEVAINGPYRNLPEPSKVLPGKGFDCYRIDGVLQKDRILEANRKNNNGKIRSDLAGYIHPCSKGSSNICTEPIFLEDPNKPKKDIKDTGLLAQAHHQARATDLRGCKWGTNSNKNAAVISARLNQHLKNKYPEAKEVNAINLIPAYTP